MNRSDILESKVFNRDGFEIEVSLVADYQSGFTQFRDKWSRCNDGLVICDEGYNFGCNWYSTGQLNKGNDVTKYQAQKEFDRDCNAFDVLLEVTISKNDIELLDQVVISDNYSWDDKNTPKELMEYLMSDYLDLDYLLVEVKETLSKLVA